MRKCAVEACLLKDRQWYRMEMHIAGPIYLHPRSPCLHTLYGLQPTPVVCQARFKFALTASASPHYNLIGLERKIAVELNWHVNTL